MVWQKGQSGNPKGPRHNKAYYEFKRQCQKYAPRSVERLADGLESSEKDVWISCARILLEYGYGKPSQIVEIGGQIDHNFIVQIPELIGESATWEEKFQPTALIAETIEE